METMAESGGVIPHRHHPIPGSGYFPQKETSPPSYFFPSNAVSQSVYRGYSGGQGGGDSISSGSSSAEVHGVMGYGGQLKGHERRGDSEERGGRVEGRRSSGGVMVPPTNAGVGGGDRYYLPPSSLSSSASPPPPPLSSISSSQSSHHPQQHSMIPTSSSSSSLSSSSSSSTSASSYHNHHQQQILHQQQQQRLADENNKKIPELHHAILESGGSASRDNAPISPEKRSSEKDGIAHLRGGEFTPKKGGMGMNLPYDANPMLSPYHRSSSSGGSKHSGSSSGRHHPQAGGFVPEGRQQHAMPGFAGSTSPQYMSDVMESVKEVYDSFVHGRVGSGSGKDGDSSGRGMKAPEAIPIAYEDSDMQSQHQQQYREKLERSTSQDAAAAMNARNIMNEYNHQLYSGRLGGGGEGGRGDHQRPRAITMNSMYSRRDSPSSLHPHHHPQHPHHQNSPYGVGGKNHDLYTKMREHFNRSEAALKNHYYYGDKDKEGGGSVGGPPISPTSPYLEKHQRRPSGESGSRLPTHAPSRPESSVSRMMMLMSPNHQSDHRQPYPPMHPHHHHQQQQQHQQHLHNLHHLQQKQQQQHQSDPDSHLQNRPSPHHSSQRKSLDTGCEEPPTYHSSKTPTNSQHPFGSSSTPTKSPMISPTSDLATQKPWASDNAASPSSPSSNSQQRQPNFQEKDDIDAKMSAPSETSSSKEDTARERENSDTDKNYPGEERNSSEITEDPVTSKLNSSSSSLSPKDDEEEDSPNDSLSRKLSSASPDDTSLPDAMPRELMPKKEILSDGEEDSFHSSSANYPPMTPPSPNSSSGMSSSYPPSFQQHPHHHQPPHHHHHRHQQQQQQQPFFHSPERIPGQMPPHPSDPFRSPRSLQDGPPGMPPAFPFNKDMPGHYPMPGMPRDMPLGPNGSPFMGGPMSHLNLGGDKDVYFCHLCSYSGKSKSDFDNHMGIHFEYNCPHCDYTSRTEGRLKRHIKDFHSDENGRRSMPGRPKVFKCKQCSFSATEKDKFWEHARSHIKEDKLLQCPKCPFVTEYKHHLEYHLRNHFGSKPFKCNKCNYSCVNKSMLNSHMKSHTNVYQYRCSDCTYATKYCHSLKLHLRKYNHKPATVLNQDGSLPQGADADASGLAVNTKRGPPRGPRGPRKDKNDPYFNQMFGGMPPMPMGIPPSMSPMLKGMMPFWPVMPPSGIPGHPGMMPGLPNMPQHMGMRGGGVGGEGMDMRGGGDRALGGGGCMDSRTSDPEMNGMMSGEDSPVKDDDEVMYMPCRLCDFVAEGTEGLCLHLLQSHKDETGEMASMYGISETVLAESFERAKKNRLEKADQIMLRRMSEMTSEPEHHHDLSEFRRRNTIAGLLSRGDNPSFGRFNSGGDKPFWAPGGFGQREKTGLDDGRIQDLCYVDDGNDDGDNENDSAGGMDILQQMTLKFGGGGGVGGTLHAERSKSMDADLMQNAEEENRHGDEEDDDDDSMNPKQKLDRKLHGHKESPLDLTKPKSVSPPMFSNPSSPRRFDEFNNSEDDDNNMLRPMWMENGRGQQSELDKVTENLVRKRQYSEVDESVGGNSSAPNPDVSAAIVPRKRSRKGKAYKLETLCLKLQERKSKSPNDSDELDSDNDFNNMDTYHHAVIKPSIDAEVENDAEKERIGDEKEKNDNEQLMEMESTQIEKENQENVKRKEADCDNTKSSDITKINNDHDDDNNDIEKLDEDMEEEIMGKDYKNGSENIENIEEKIKNEPVESCSENENKDDKTDEKVEAGDKGEDDDASGADQIVKKEPIEEDEDEADNSFEKLQEALKDLSKDITEKEDGDKKDVSTKRTDEEGASSSITTVTLSNEHNSRKEEDEDKTDTKDKSYHDNDDSDKYDDNTFTNDDNNDDDDDDDDAKTEILGEDLTTTTDDHIFDLSDKEASNDGMITGGGFENTTSSSHSHSTSPPPSPSSAIDKTTASDEVKIEDKVDMINTVLENRKKPLPPAVRRGTELAWKLLNDPVNPVTSIPIPVVSPPPPPEWKAAAAPSHQRPTSPMMTSPLGSTNAGGIGLGASISTSHAHHHHHHHLANTNNLMTSPMKNGLRLTNPTSPFNNQGGLPQSPINLNMKPPQHHHHLPIPLPPTPMAFIPPTNRMMPEHAMSRPPPLQAPPHPPIPPMSKSVPKDMYECTYCDLSFRDCVMYTVHMGYHSNRNPFKCNSCGIICRDKVEFFLHIARSPHS